MVPDTTEIRLHKGWSEFAIFLNKHGLGVGFVWTDSSKIALFSIPLKKLNRVSFYESHLFHN